MIMACACPCARRTTFVSVKLQQQTLKSWIEAKCYLKINGNNALVNHLLELATLSTVSSKVSSNNNICETHHGACFLGAAIVGRNYYWYHYPTHNLCL